jgi:hypothetical protein
VVEDNELDLNEVSKRLRLSKRMVFHRIRRNDIKAHKRGWQWFVFESEVEIVKDLEWYRNSRLQPA